jgi:hypothetical protein
MQATDFTSTIVVDQAPETAFAAISNVREWWSGEIEGSANNTGDEFTYQVSDVHFSIQKVTDMIPGKRKVWQVTESTLNFVSEKSEWTGTQIIFDINIEGDKTKVTFTHKGLVPEVECYNACSGGWERIIQQSLLSAITTGKGVKIF